MQAAQPVPVRRGRREGSPGPDQAEHPAMTEFSTPSAPPADASADEIEADMAATRERLAESVDALADKVNVKAQAERKVEETKQQAKAKVGEATDKAKATAGEAVGHAQRLVD